MRVVVPRLAGILILITVAETSLSGSCVLLQLTDWVNSTELGNFSQLLLEGICSASRALWLSAEVACSQSRTHMMEGETELLQVFSLTSTRLPFQIINK